MYKIIVNSSEYTIPKKNIRMLAISKMMETKRFQDLPDEQSAVDYFRSLGCKVEEE